MPLILNRPKAMALAVSGRNKTLFCVLEDELLSASDELLRETGQPHHAVRSHNELNVAKVASCVSVFSTFFSNFSKTEIFTEILQKFTILETASIAEALQKPAACAKPMTLLTLGSKGKSEGG